MKRTVLLVLCLLAMLATNALAQTPVRLNPNACYSTSLLPMELEFWQGQGTWFGLAVAPVYNLSPEIDLEMQFGEDAASRQSYSPPVISSETGTNFFVRNYGGQPDHWQFGEARAADGQNYNNVLEWDPGSGGLSPGSPLVLSYGGSIWECGLIRVYSVYLEAGKTYHFNYTTDHPGDDMRLALCTTGTRPDGWVGRADALFEKVADDAGSAVPESFTATTSANYGLVVFLNDDNVGGGEVTLSYEEYIVPVNTPDLIVTGISPSSVNAGQSAQVTIYLSNVGTAASGTCQTQFSVDGTVTCGTIATPSLAVGASTSVTCSLAGLTGGSHPVSATVDIADEVAEVDELNNTYDDYIYATVPGSPDLVIETWSPATVLPNRTFQINVYVRNSGASDAAATSTRIRLDSGTQDFQVATPAIATGQGVFISQSVQPLSPGSHLLWVELDDGGVVSESDEANNTLISSISAEGPNLVVDQITPLNTTTTTVPQFDIVVHNIGNGDAVGSNTSLHVDGVLVSAAIATGPLVSGASTTVQVSATGLLGMGDHTAEACADAGAVVTENDEGDNCLAVTVTATPTSAVVYADGSGDFATIQAAIDTVSDGGEILLAPEVFTGDGNRDLDFHGKDLTVISIFGGRATINCQGDPETPHRAFYFHSGESAAAEVRNVDITGGWDEYGAGGGILIGDAEPTITNCIIHHCHADGGGAVAFTATSPYHPTLDGCTLVSNYANNGSAVSVGGSSGPNLNNTLIAANFGLRGAFFYEPNMAAVMTLGCCDVWGNSGGDYTAGAAGQLGQRGNISQDPLFCDAAAQDYYVATNSPCTVENNAGCGRTGALPANCGTLGGTVRHVKADGTGEYITIWQAVLACVDGDVVELADGIYTGSGNWDVATGGLAITVRSASGDPLACRIDCQDAHRGFRIYQGEGPDTIITGIGVVRGAADIGAAIECDNASPTLDNLYLADSNATNDGGGIYCRNSASPHITGCLLENNSAADDGGGLFATDYSSPVVEDTQFTGNLCNDRGAGAVFVVNSFPTLNRCIFLGNEGVNGGGVAFVYAYGPLNDCIFRDNFADFGGGVQCYGNAHSDFTGCTFSGNRATHGSGVYLRGGSSPTFDRTLIVFGDLGNAFDRYADDCVPVLSCVDIHGTANFGDWTAMVADQLATNGNINADPLFCDRLGGTLTLRGDSPCAEVNNPGCGQMGALGVGCTGSWLVKPDGSGDFATIQAALDAAVDGESVVLADGTYTGNGNRDLNFLGKAITLRGQSSDPTLCIIDCAGSATDPHQGIAFVSGETLASVLEYVTITGANMTYGGAINLANGSSPRIRHCILRDNGAGSGAGMLLGGGSNPYLDDVLFENNTASNAGGGLYANASFPQATDCVFRGNHAVYGGGAWYNQHAGGNITRCVLTDNTSDHWGGALHNRYADSSPVVTNCLFTDNSAPEGGAIYNRDGAWVSLLNSTLVGNLSADGAGLTCRNGSGATLTRDIIAFSSGAAVTDDGASSVIAYCCDVYGNAGGNFVGPLVGQDTAEGNFAADPVFCDRYQGVYSLASVSSCLAANSSCGALVGAYDQGCALSGVEQPSVLLPTDLSLAPNVPNPFNPATVIRYDLPAAANVNLDVFDLEGRRVARLVNAEQPAGRHEITWRARDDQGRGVASGLYLVRLKAAGQIQVQKIMLAR